MSSLIVDEIGDLIFYVSIARVVVWECGQRRLSEEIGLYKVNRLLYPQNYVVDIGKFQVNNV